MDKNKQVEIIVKNSKTPEERIKAHESRAENVDKKLSYGVQNSRYNVKDMVKYLKSKFDVDFYSISYGDLKEKATQQKSYLLDIACDVKELINEKDSSKYFNISTMLDLFLENSVKKKTN